MDTKAQQPKQRDDVLSSLNAAIEAMDIAKKVPAGVSPAIMVFGSVSNLLTTIRVHSPLFSEDLFRAHTWLGLYGQ